MSTPDLPPPDGQLLSLHPFRRAVLGGLGILLPPLLTIVFFLWVWNTVAIYVLDPLETSVRWMLVKSTADIRSGISLEKIPSEDGSPSFTARLGEQIYHQTGDRKYVPLEVYRRVEEEVGPAEMPTTALKVYQTYVELAYLQHYVVVPIFLCVFVLFLYLLGKFMAAGIGRFFWTRFEHLIHRLPLIRNVYSSVKQVTDYLFNDHSMEYTRVVAIEYPRKGLWALAFVTGESLLDIRSAANEPVLSLLVPTSPMPFTGFTTVAKKSECLDLNLTIDQALQYIVSCGVVVPPHQLVSILQKSSQPDALPSPAHAEELVSKDDAD